jgi:hypothetical protein
MRANLLIKIIIIKILKTRGWGGKGHRKKTLKKKKTLFRILFLFYVLNGQIIRKLK